MWFAMHIVRIAANCLGGTHMPSVVDQDMGWSTKVHLDEVGESYPKSSINDIRAVAFLRMNGQFALALASTSHIL